MKRATFFATCAPGLEPVLHEEVRSLRLAKSERQVGGVRFEGTLADAWKANLELATCGRVLLRLARFGARDADELYQGAAAVDWRRFLAPDGTLRVEARSKESELDHSLFVEQRVKDAVVDQLRDGSVRPSVASDPVDLRIDVHLFRNRCTLSADTSGAPLYKRGWRKAQARAPLAETLAAGILRLAGWDRRSPLVDPFCGSGTLLVEAALWASDTAPGLLRVGHVGFAFEGWPGHDAKRFARLVESVRARSAFPPKLVLRGADLAPAAIDAASQNLAAAGFEGKVLLEESDARALELRGGWNAQIATNPPYGHRVGSSAEVEATLRELGAIWRERLAGYRVALLSGSDRLTAALGLPNPKRIPIKNGALDCELLIATL